MSIIKLIIKKYQQSTMVELTKDEKAYKQLNEMTASLEAMKIQ